MSVSKKGLAELTKNVKKALSPREKSLDPQLTSVIIELTYRSSGATQAYWQAGERQLLTVNRFTAWKFCTLLHKLLRHGHKQLLHDSQSLEHRQRLHAIGSFWATQPDTLPQCTTQYCKVLLAKLQFHQTYPFFNGALQLLTSQPWETNVCFQLCSDIYDLIEELLRLQQLVFDDWQGDQADCRLAPLVYITEECSMLYQHCVTALGVLYAALPPEDVAGLRERFYVIFPQLQAFYWSMRVLRCITDRIQIPVLPNYPPNFCNNRQTTGYQGNGVWPATWTPVPMAPMAATPTAPLANHLH